MYLTDLDWPLTAKETLVVTNGCIDVTGTRRVRFVMGDAVGELRRMKANGDGSMVAYGEEIGSLLLNSGLVDEITVITVPGLAGGSEKALVCGQDDGRGWSVQSSKVLEDGTVRTVYGKV